MRWFRSRNPINSPVLVVDALGVGHRIHGSDGDALTFLADELESQFHCFRAKVPHQGMIVTQNHVWGTKEFSTVRLNDMFVLFSEREIPDPALRYMVAASILYHQLLLSGFMPRGGLGFGLVLRRKEMVLGGGFLDAYNVAEKRSDDLRHICAIELSSNFCLNIANTEHSWRLVCLYKDRLFLNPRALVDPEMGEFDNERITSLLANAGANDQKLQATQAFLDNLEDYDSAKLPGSRSRALTGWISPDER